MSRLPDVHVHSLGEFEYCPRAGVMAFENQSADRVDDEGQRIPDLSFAPSFEYQVLKEQLSAIGARLIQSVGLCVAFGTALSVIAYFAGLEKMWPMWLAMVIPAMLLVTTWQDWLELFKEYVRFRTAPGAKLLHELPQAPVEVDWRELAKTYHVRIVQESYLDSDLALIGRPWAILSWHNYRIPVIRSYHLSSLEKLKSTHAIKLAAYCHLVRVVENSLSDWGIVISNVTRTGIAIPVGDDDVERVKRKLDEFRIVLERHFKGTKPAKGNPEACANCPFNRRRLYCRGQSETKVAGNPIRANISPDDNTHCDCGDRFQWTPPVANV